MPPYITLSNTENISVILGTTTSVESQVMGGSSSQVCITPPQIRDRASHPPNISVSVHGYQDIDMLDYNLDSDDEIETVSVMVVDEAGTWCQ